MTDALHPALSPLIEALARQAVQDYLTAKPAANEAAQANRPNPAPLQTVHKAA